MKTGFRGLLRCFWWYHWNEYSNPGTKGLEVIIILLFLLASFRTPTCLFLALVIYIILLCDRGFGEPECPF